MQIARSIRSQIAYEFVCKALSVLDQLNLAIFGHHDMHTFTLICRNLTEQQNNSTGTPTQCNDKANLDYLTKKVNN